MRPAWFLIALGGVFALVSYWLPGVALLVVPALLTALTLLWFQRRAEVRMDAEYRAEVDRELKHERVKLDQLYDQRAAARDGYSSSLDMDAKIIMALRTQRVLMVARDVAKIRDRALSDDERDGDYNLRKKGTS